MPVLGPGREVCGGKGSAFPLGDGVRLVVRCPGLGSPNGRHRALVSQVDRPPRSYRDEVRTKSREPIATRTATMPVESKRRRSNAKSPCEFVDCWGSWSLPIPGCRAGRGSGVGIRRRLHEVCVDDGRRPSKTSRISFPACVPTMTRGLSCRQRTRCLDARLECRALSGEIRGLDPMRMPWWLERSPRCERGNAGEMASSEVVRWMPSALKCPSGSGGYGRRWDTGSG